MSPNKLLFAIALFLLTAFAHGQSEIDRVSPSGLIIQTILGLSVVIAAIFVFAWLAKKLQGQNFGRGNGLQILAAMPVGPKEKAVLIKVNGKSILLGVAPGRVSALHVFEQSPADNQHLDDVDDELDEVDEQQQYYPHTGAVQLKTQALAARSPSEFSKKLQAFLGQGKPQS